MPALLKGIALLLLLFIALISFLVYTVYKLSERTAMNESNPDDGTITMPGTSSTKDLISYEYSQRIKKN